MKATGSVDDGDDRFRRLYELHRTNGIKHAAALLMGEPNRYILGIEAEEMFDEAMELYYRKDEHLIDDVDHERNIKHRIRMVRIAWVRMATAKKRKPPGPTVSLDEPIVSGDGEKEIRLDPPDPHAKHEGEDRIDIEDAVARIPSPDERTAALARLRGETYEEIAEDTGVSEEGARQRVRRAAEELKDALEEDP